MLPDHTKVAPSITPIIISAVTPPGETRDGSPLTCATPKQNEVKRITDAAL